MHKYILENMPSKHVDLILCPKDSYKVSVMSNQRFQCAGQVLKHSPIVLIWVQSKA